MSSSLQSNSEGVDSGVDDVAVFVILLKTIQESCDRDLKHFYDVSVRPLSLIVVVASRMLHGIVSVDGQGNKLQFSI